MPPYNPQAQQVPGNRGGALGPAMEAGSATAAPCPQVDPHPLPHNQIGGRPRWRWRQRQLRQRRRSPHLGDSDVPRSIKKTHPPSFILSGRPFFEVIAQGCNWIAVITATGNTKCCNLSINRGGPRQADPYAGEQGGGARVWPTCRWVGHVGPGRAGGWRRPGGGLCICCSKCNKVHFSLAVYIYIVYSTPGY